MDVLSFSRSYFSPRFFVLRSPLWSTLIVFSFGPLTSKPSSMQTFYSPFGLFCAVSAQIQTVHSFSHFLKLYLALLIYLPRVGIKHVFVNCVMVDGPSYFSK